MRMKRFFGGAFGLLALVSCSNDELTSVNRDGDEIAFNVVTNSPTRAGDVYGSNKKPTDFKVWATFNGQTYINGDEIHSDDGNTWINNSGTRYWPDGEVTFYAHCNADAEFQWNDGSPTINYTVEDALAQKDLIYAVKKQTKDGEDGKAVLNFRHALSQVVFQAKNTNKNLYVEISGVSVCKLGKTNTFAYPSENTEGNTWGTWNVLNGGPKTYSVNFDPVGVPGDNAVKDLTSKNDEGKEYNSNAMLLLPQTSNAWIVKKGEAITGTPANQGGTYFLVKCQIYNVAGATVDTEHDVCLWGQDAPKDVAIPVKLDWTQGKKYIYTFIFGDGNGGYDPDPDIPNDPTPVLVPITFNVTVDDFVPVNNEDIKMDKPEESQPASAA